MKLRLRRIALIVLGSIAALPVAALIALFTYIAVACYEPGWGNKPFSSQAWQTADRDTRYLYVNDLIHSRKLNGLSSEQVRGLLGRPDHENDQGDFRYLVKPQDCSADDWALDISFDRKGAVREYIIRIT